MNTTPNNLPTHPPSCGSCDAERLALKQAHTPHVNWTSPSQMEAWNHRQFSVSSPETFEAEYKRTRAWCDESGATDRWSASKSVIEHTREYQRAQYGFPCAHEGGFCR